MNPKPSINVSLVATDPEVEYAVLPSTFVCERKNRQTSIFGLREPKYDTFNGTYFAVDGETIADVTLKVAQSVASVLLCQKLNFEMNENYVKEFNKAMKEVMDEVAKKIQEDK